MFPTKFTAYVLKAGCFLASFTAADAASAQHRGAELAQQHAGDRYVVLDEGDAGRSQMVFDSRK